MLLPELSVPSTAGGEARGLMKTCKLGPKKEAWGSDIRRSTWSVSRALRALDFLGLELRLTDITVPLLTRDFITDTKEGYPQSYSNHVAPGRSLINAFFRFELDDARTFNQSETVLQLECGPAVTYRIPMKVFEIARSQQVLTQTIATYSVLLWFCRRPFAVQC